MNGDADSSHMLKRSCKVFPLSGNVKALHLLRKKKKKKSCAEVAKVYGKNKSFIHEIEKKYVLVLQLYFKLKKLQP